MAHKPRPSVPTASSDPPVWNRPEFRVVSYLRTAVQSPVDPTRSFWLPQDIIGHGGKTLIIYRVADDTYSIDGWEAWHDGMFGGRRDNVESAIAWVDRAVAVRAGTARDFLGV